ncbi:MAG: T9SS type A sorting domain-containing protein [Bacteroidia bacterium]
MGREGGLVIAGDWDMDGDPDLAYISEGSPQFGLNLAFQVAPNEFQDSLLSGSVNSWSPWLLKSDFDQDGDPDIIEFLGQASNKPFLWIFRNDGTGNFSPKEALSDTVYYLSGSVKIIDWNNDNYDDFIYTSSSRIIYFENLGGTTLAAPDTLVSSCGSCGGFYITDTDNNGLQDIVYQSNTANGIVILKKIDGSAQFVSDTVAVGAGLSVSFVFDDLNADGVKDIISAVNDSLQIKVNLMGPAQTGSPLIAYTYPASITALGLADLNQDGLNDLYGRYSNGHKIFWAFRDPGNPLQFIPQQMTDEVQVFPNPGAGQLNIRCASDNLIDKVEIFSLDGKLCAQQIIIPACDVQLKAPESNGVYLIRAYTQTGIHTTRFVCAGN